MRRTVAVIISVALLASLVLAWPPPSGDASLRAWATALVAVFIWLVSLLSIGVVPSKFKWPLAIAAAVQSFTAPLLFLRVSGASSSETVVPLLAISAFFAVVAVVNAIAVRR